MPLGAPQLVDRFALTATLLFGAAAMAALIVIALTVLDRSAALVALVYGTTLVACSAASYLYHTFENAPRRHILRYLDHAAIFLLIAGTYTPFAARGIRGPFGLGQMLEWVWALALIGVAAKLLLDRSYDRLFVGLYLALGWLFVAAIDQILATVTPLALGFLAVGGIAYTLGAVVYSRGIGHWTDPVWHCCVLIGSLTHFIAVLALLLAVRNV